jgi:hypothetical protein
MNAPAVWLIYTLLLGYPVESGGGLKFTNQSGCELYMRANFKDEVIQAFQLVCFKQPS